MTTDAKIALALCGLFISFIFGWFAPLVWLLFVAGCIALLAVPTKKRVSQTSYQVTAPAATTEQDYSRIQAQLQSMIADEKDEKVQEGLRRALQVVSANASTPSYTMSDVQPRPVLTEAEVAEQKKRQELRNINTILYTASFLLVGAAALFIGFNDLAGPTLKFFTVLLAALAFYATGLIVHKNSVRLMPAATAFVGTGLALIPFVGLALNSFVLHQPALAWWITSIFGLVLFLVAVHQIRSTVMAYLSLAFVFSLATSTASVLDTPFVWYFVSIIVTSSLLTYAAYKIPKIVPEEFVKPLDLNAQIATPVALIGSILAASTFNAFEYAMVSGVGALHYLVATLAYGNNKTRFIYWSAARVLLIIFAASLVFHFTQEAKYVWTTILLSGIAAHLYSIARVNREPREIAWLWAAVGLISISIFGWLNDPLLVSSTLLVVLAVSLWQFARIRSAEYALSGIIAALILPLTVFRGVVEPPVAYEIIAGLAVSIAALSLLVRWLAVPRSLALKQVLTLLYGTFLAEAIILSALSNDPLSFGTVMLISGGLLHVASFIERTPSLTIGSNVMLMIGVFAIYGQVFDSYTWVPLATALTLGAGWYGLSWYHRRAEAVDVDDQSRSLILAISSVAILGIGSLIAMFQTDETIVAGALMGCLTAGLIAYEGAVRRKLIGYEIAAYVATFSLQRLVAHVYPDASWLLYTHWWALTGLAVAGLYYNRTKNRDTMMVRAIISLAVLSLPTGFSALIDSTGMYRMLFLFEHVIIATAGLVLNKRLAVYWGAAGIGLAVLYMLQGYTYLLLVLIAIVLIMLAVWRLTKKG